MASATEPGSGHGSAAAPSRPAPPSQASAILPARRSLLLACALAIALVNLLNLAALLLRPWASDGLASGTATWLLMTNESNPSTWLSSALFLVGAALAFFCGQVEVRTTERRWWYLLALLLVVLSVDETASLHERLDDYLKLDSWLDLPGFLKYAWVIPGVLVLAAVALTFRRFITSLPARTRRGLYLAAALVVAGGVGAELLASWWDSSHGVENAGLHLISTLEENLELVGATVAVLVLRRHLGPAPDELPERRG